MIEGERFVYVIAQTKDGADNAVFAECTAFVRREGREGVNIRKNLNLAELANEGNVTVINGRFLL